MTALPRHLARRAVLGATLAFLACSHAGRANAGISDVPARAWGSLAILGGSTLVDSRLADFQWDTRPRMAWGAQVLAGRGRLAIGVRAWRSQTVQALDLPSGPVSPVVSTTTLELLARGCAATLAGARLWGCASVGQLRLDYRPDHVVVSSGGPGGTVVADLAPVRDWTAGAGVALERPLGSRWNAGLSLDRQFFSLDTAHRSGAAIVNRRESFGDWSARFELAWLIPFNVKETSR